MKKLSYVRFMLTLVCIEFTIHKRITSESYIQPKWIYISIEIKKILVFVWSIYGNRFQRTLCPIRPARITLKRNGDRQRPRSIIKMNCMVADTDYLSHSLFRSISIFKLPRNVFQTLLYFLRNYRIPSIYPLSFPHHSISLPLCCSHCLPLSTSLRFSLSISLFDSP